MRPLEVTMTERLQILIAIHGHEPDGWTEEVRLALTPTNDALLRVLIVDAPRAAGFTSLLPPARRRHAAAVRLTRGIAADERRRRLDTLVSRLPAHPEVVHTPGGSDAGRAIVAHATAWPAHIVVVGRDERPSLPRWLVPAIHERVVREAPCAVIVAAPASSAVALVRRRVYPVVTELPR
jgi:nucleotide-binding universal stress UspA family protein